MGHQRPGSECVHIQNMPDKQDLAVILIFPSIDWSRHGGQNSNTVNTLRGKRKKKTAHTNNIVSKLVVSATSDKSCVSGTIFGSSS